MNYQDQQDWEESLFGRGAGDFDFPSKPKHIRYIGIDKAVVERHVDDTHWSQLPKPVRVFEGREFGDNNKSDPEQNWEKE